MHSHALGRCARALFRAALVVAVSVGCWSAMSDHALAQSATTGWFTVTNSGLINLSTGTGGGTGGWTVSSGTAPPISTATTLTFTDNIAGATTLNNDINGTTGFTGLTGITFSGTQGVTITGNGFKFTAAASSITFSTGTTVMAETFSAPVTFAGTTTTLGASQAGSSITFNALTLSGILGISANMSVNAATLDIAGGNRTITNSAAVATNGSTFSAIVLNADGSDHILTFSGIGNNTLNGAITGGGNSGIYLAGTGTTTISNNNSGFLGNMTISGAQTVALVSPTNALGMGNLTISAAITLLANAPSMVTVANPTITLTGATLTLNSSTSQGMAITGTVINSGGNRTITNNDVSGLTISGTLRLSESGAAVGRLLTLAGTGNTTLNATIDANATNTGGFSIVPTGGNVTISGLSVGSGIGGDAVPTLAISPGATAFVTISQDLSAFTNPLSLSGTGTISLAVTSNPLGTSPVNNTTINILRPTVAGITIGNNITLGANITIADFANSSGLTLSGTVTNSGGNRTITNNDLTGGLTLSGTLMLSESGAAVGRLLTLAGTGNTTLNAVIDSNATNTGGFSIIPTAGSVTISGLSVGSGIGGDAIPTLTISPGAAASVTIAQDLSAFTNPLNLNGTGTISLAVTSNPLGTAAVNNLTVNILRPTVAGINIANSITLGANLTIADFAATGLTLSGTITNSAGPRIITNNNNTGLTLSGNTLYLSESTALVGRLLTIAGTGNTTLSSLTLVANATNTGGFALVPTGGGVTLSGLAIGGSAIPNLTFSPGAAATVTLATDLTAFTSTNSLGGTGTVSLAIATNPLGSGVINNVAASVLRPNVTGITLANNVTLAGNLTIADPLNTSFAGLTLSGTLTNSAANRIITASNVTGGTTISGTLMLSESGAGTGRLLTIAGTGYTTVSAVVDANSTATGGLQFGPTGGGLTISGLSVGSGIGSDAMPSLTFAGTTGTITIATDLSAFTSTNSVNGTGTIAIGIGANLNTPLGSGLITVSGNGIILPETSGINITNSINLSASPTVAASPFGLTMSGAIITLNSATRTITNNNAGLTISDTFAVGVNGGQLAVAGAGYTTITDTLAALNGINSSMGAAGIATLSNGYAGTGGTITLTSGTLVANGSLTTGGATAIWAAGGSLTNLYASPQNFGLLTDTAAATIASVNGGGMSFNGIIGGTSTVHVLALSGALTTSNVMFVDTAAATTPITTLSLTIANNATLSMSAAGAVFASTYSAGPATVLQLQNNGQISFDNTTTNVTRIAAPSATAGTLALSIVGNGTLSFLSGGGNTASSLLGFGAVTLTSGVGTINFGNANTATVSAQTLTAVAGAALDISTSATLGTTQTVSFANGVSNGQFLTGVVFVNEKDFATYSAINGVQSATAFYQNVAANGALGPLTGTNLVENINASLNTSISGGQLAMAGLKLNGGDTVSAADSVSYLLLTYGGTILGTNAGGIIATGGTSTITAPIVWSNGGNQVMTIDVASTSDNLYVNYLNTAIEGVLGNGTGTGSLEKIGLGTLTIGGGLGLTAGNGLFISEGTVALGTGITPFVNTGPTITMSPGTTLNLNGLPSVFIAGLNGYGTVQLGNAATNETLTLGGTATSFTYGGTFTNSGAVYTLAKTGTGTATFSNSANLSGITNGVNVLAGGLNLGMNPGQFFTGGLTLTSTAAVSFSGLYGGSAVLGPLVINATSSTSAAFPVIEFTTPGSVTFSGASSAATNSFVLMRGTGFGSTNNADIYLAGTGAPTGVLPWAVGDVALTGSGSGLLAVDSVSALVRFAVDSDFTLPNTNNTTPTDQTQAILYNATGATTNITITNAAAAAVMVDLGSANLSAITLSGPGAGATLTVGNGILQFTGSGATSFAGQTATLNGFNNGLRLGTGVTNWTVIVNNTNGNTLAETVTVASPFVGTTLTKDGNGVLDLAAANSLTGAVTVNSGSLVIANAAALTAANAVTLETLDTLTISDNLGTVTLAGLTGVGASNNLYVGQNDTLELGTFTGSISTVMATGSSLIIGINNAVGTISTTSLTVAPGQTTPLTITKLGSGAQTFTDSPLTLSANAASPGTINVTSGSLLINANTATSTLSNAIVNMSPGTSLAWTTSATALIIQDKLINNDVINLANASFSYGVGTTTANITANAGTAVPISFSGQSAFTFVQTTSTGSTILPTTLTRVNDGVLLVNPTSGTYAAAFAGGTFGGVTSTTDTGGMNMLVTNSSSGFLSGTLNQNNPNTAIVPFIVVGTANGTTAQNVAPSSTSVTFATFDVTGSLRAVNSNETVSTVVAGNNVVLSAAGTGLSPFSANTAVNALSLVNTGTTTGVAAFTGTGQNITISSGLLISAANANSVNGNSLAGINISFGNTQSVAVAGVNEGIIYAAMPTTLAANIVDNSGTPVMITKAGLNTLTLSGANLYSGGTNLEAGTLAVVAGNSLGNGSNLTISGNSALQFGAAGVTVTQSVFVASSVTTILDASLNSGTISGNISLASSFSGVVLPESTATSNIVVLSGANNFSGSTMTLSGGWLGFGNTSAVNGLSTIFVTTNSGFQPAVANMVVASNILLGGANATLGGNLAVSADLGIASGGGLTLSGVITNSGSRQITTSNSTGLTLSGGIVLAEAITARTLTFAGIGPVYITGTITNSGANNVLNNLDATGGLTITGTVALSETSLTGRVLTINGAGNTYINATFTNIGTGGLTLAPTAGANAITMAGNLSTYSNTLSISSGLVQLATTSNPLGVGTVDIAGAATVGVQIAGLTLNNNFALNNTFTITGTQGVTLSGTITNSLGGRTLENYNNVGITFDGIIAPSTATNTPALMAITGTGSSTINSNTTIIDYANALNSSTVGTLSNTTGISALEFNTVAGGNVTVTGNVGFGVWSNSTTFADMPTISFNGAAGSTVTLDANLASLSGSVFGLVMNGTVVIATTSNPLGNDGTNGNPMTIVSIGATTPQIVPGIAGLNITQTMSLSGLETISDSTQLLGTGYGLTLSGLMVNTRLTTGQLTNENMTGLTLAGRLLLADPFAARTFEIWGAGATTISGSLNDNGTGASVVNYASTTESGNVTISTGVFNYYSGATTLGTGTLFVNDGRPFGSGALALGGGANGLGTLSFGTLPRLTNNITGGTGVLNVAGSLIYSGTMSGATGITLTGGGTMYGLGNSTNTIGAVINGTTFQGRSLNALGAGAVTLGNGGVLDVGGTALSVSGLTSANGFGLVTNGIGTLGALIIAPTTSTGLAYTGQLNDGFGQLAVVKEGAATSTASLAGSGSFSGGIAVVAGTLFLDYTNNNAAKFSSNSTITAGGGILSLLGSTTSSTIQNVATLAVGVPTGVNAYGASSTVTVSTGTLAINAISRAVGGGVVDFNTANGGTIAYNGTGVGNSVLIVGEYATANGGKTWAGLSGGNIVPLTTYDVNAPASVENLSISANTVMTSTGFNSLLFGSSASLTLAAGTTTITSGGVLAITAGASSIAGTISGGALTSGTHELNFILNNLSTGFLSVSSNIVDNGAPVAVTKNGLGTLYLGGTANAFSGGLNVDNGLVVITKSGALPASTNSAQAGTVNLYGGNVAGSSLGGGINVTTALLSVAGSTYTFNIYGNATLSGGLTASGGIVINNIGANNIVTVGATSTYGSIVSGAPVGTINLSDSTSTGHILTVSTSAVTLTINGTIQDYAGQN
jgi:hypothetical protein